MKLIFKFDEKKEYVIDDVGRENMEDINKAIWLLLNTLNAVEVTIIK